MAMQDACDDEETMRDVNALQVQPGYYFSLNFEGCAGWTTDGDEDYDTFSRLLFLRLYIKGAL